MRLRQGREGARQTQDIEFCILALRHPASPHIESVGERHLKERDVPDLLIGGQRRAKIDREPDLCPICHRNITPDAMFVIQNARSGIFKAAMEVVYKCPNSRCAELFISYFNDPTGAPNDPNCDCFRLKASRPSEPAALEFAKHIADTSSNFCDIYNEAHKAEQFGLTQICGVGYRKSLEFLIKDYLIKHRPAEKATIETIMLGPCIENYITDPRIKEVAKRATWLGNDETHYQRRWVDKDLTDLKTMISLALHWIEAEHLTEEALKSMPAPSKP